MTDLHHYDTYVPILSDIEKHHTWDQAVDVVLESLAPLGSEYTARARRGSARPLVRSLSESWQTERCVQLWLVRRRSVHLDELQSRQCSNDVFTLTHEAGHSMHSWYSARSQPFQYYNYTIFVAEVASTFNEQLLTDYLLKNAGDDDERAYLINNELDSIRATVVRQTMFAEFEKRDARDGRSGRTVDGRVVAERPIVNCSTPTSVPTL